MTADELIKLLEPHRGKEVCVVTPIWKENLEGRPEIVDDLEYSYLMDIAEGPFNFKFDETTIGIYGFMNSRECSE